MDSSSLPELRPSRLSKSDWLRIEEIFLQLVDLGPEECASRLDHLRGAEPHLLNELESLLAADPDSGLSIELAVQAEAASLLDEPALIGQRLGLYRIVSELGRGGMGTVYLANRDDEEFERKVALKIVKRGMDTAEVLARFRHERQILANLEHPYIARLFDGGRTDDGVPFFVMEYVEGKPVNQFCRENRLSYRERCELFLRMLEAVAYAHRSLVVHRDLKPANVLITAEGIPKLLDFGVASILRPRDIENPTVTVTMGLCTPGYASPEQVLGHRLTTATDIYSLGAILYEMLSGRRAQRIESHTPAEIIRVVCETEPGRPGKNVRDFPSELDDIVLMAMRKEPDRRYGSAVEFADDIRRFLAGRPVTARQDTFGYRVRKFFLRNRLEAALVTALSVSLIAGLFVSIAEARRAERARRTAESQRVIAEEETVVALAARSAELQQKAVADDQRMVADQEREVAEKQRSVAEQRTKDMVDLAGHALFDVHDAIAQLPGSMDARRMVVKTALEYLQHLEEQQGVDDHMRQALAGGYYKVAMIQGDPSGASLQDFDASEASLRKGELNLMPAYNRHPDDPELMLRLIDLRSGMAALELRANRQEQGIRDYLALLPIAHRLSNVSRCALICKTQEGTIETLLATNLMSTDSGKALAHAERAITLNRALLKQHPGDFNLEQSLGGMTAAAAGALRNLGELQKAGDYYRESIAARERLLELHPTNAQVRRNLMVVYGNYEVLLGIPWSANLNRPDEARFYGAKSVAIARQCIKDDPNDATARRDLGMSLSRLGMVEPEPNGVAQSLATLREARSLIEPIAKANSKSTEAGGQVALILEYEGHRLEQLGNQAEALESYRQSVEAVRAFLDMPVATILSQYLSDVDNINRLQMAASQTAPALDLANDALARAVHFSDHNPRSDLDYIILGRAWALLSIAQDAAGQHEQSKASAVQALALWEHLNNTGRLAQHRQLVDKMHRFVALTSN